ncbi:sensor histidine kinase [Streptomyces sp. NBC_01108]|uniref:sensor histidine kinase n=1 Tax=Streptomyces sp. NBC_01108 TaxID=2903751 RepID=UPI003873CC41|nr:sensor histidine kinase [Streptomyces sp. NBC_01108]
MSDGACMSEGIMRKARRIALSFDGPVVAAVALGLLAAVESAGRAGAGQPDLPLTLPLAILLGLCTTLPLALLRVHPAAAATAVTAASLLALAGYRDLTLAGLVAQLLALHRLGNRGSRRLAVLLVVPYVAVALTDPDDTVLRVYAVTAAVLSAAAVADGIGRRTRAEAVARDATERAIADTLLEHVARGERARIARELHDVVAHHISVISVQAETARLTTPGMPEAGAKRLRDIGDTARTALTEMRRLLGVLREDAGTPPVTRKPQPGLTQLNELLDEAREVGGAGARLIVSGPVSPLDPGIELTTYRIVQEALTNARRHAPGAAVDVELRYAPQALDLRIRDNGPGPDRSGSGARGHGLLGMRERVAAVGGELRAGPAPGGGFLVEARLPVDTKEVLR